MLWVPAQQKTSLMGGLLIGDYTTKRVGAKNFGVRAAIPIMALWAVILAGMPKSSAMDGSLENM